MLPYSKKNLKQYTKANTAKNIVLKVGKLVRWGGSGPAGEERALPRALACVLHKWAPSPQELSGHISEQGRLKQRDTCKSSKKLKRMSSTSTSLVFAHPLAGVGQPALKAMEIVASLTGDSCTWEEMLRKRF